MESNWHKSAGEIRFEDEAFEKLAIEIANEYNARFDQLLLQHADESYVAALLKKQGYSLSVEVGFQLVLTYRWETPSFVLVVEESRNSEMWRDAKRGKARIIRK